MNKFTLDNKPKIESGFTVPDGYFDLFSSTVTDVVFNDQQQKVISIKPSSNWQFAAAAVLVLSLMIPTLNKLEKPALLPDQKAIENYIATRSEISSDELLNIISPDDLTYIHIDNNIDRAIIEDELSDQNIDHLLY